MPKQFRSSFRVGKTKAHIRRKDNGVYEIRCQINHTRYSASARVLEEAKMKFIECLNKPQNDRTKAIYLADYTFNWLETVKKPCVKENSYYEFTKAFNNYIKKDFSTKKIVDITQTDMQKYFNAICDLGKNNTAQKLYVMIKSVLNYAIGDDIITKNPLDRVKIVRKDSKEGMPFSRAEERIVIDLCIQGNIYFTALLFYIYTGIRKNEIHSVVMSDDFVTVKTLKIKKGKAEQYRKIPISPMLKTYLPYIDVDKVKAVDMNHLNYYIKKVFPTHHLHEARHTFITRCQECGIQREYVSLWAGHSSDSSTTSKTYTHLKHYEEAQIKAMSLFFYDI